MSVFIVIIGVEYVDYADAGKMDRLPGPHYDTKCVLRVLRKRHPTPADVWLLTDNSKGMQPTRKNIEQTICLAVDSASKVEGATVWLYYSGHGTQLSALKPELELDGKDEVIVPCDFLTEGFIRDDWLHATVSKLHPSNTLCAFWDCCNSGTLMDLPHNLIEAGVMPTESLPACPVIFSISGCLDDQSSISAWNIKDNKRWQGAMTWALCAVLRSTMNSGAYPFQLHKRIQNRLTSRNYKQRAQLSSNVPPNSLACKV